jgi:hypothetical protein
MALIRMTVWTLLLAAGQSQQPFAIDVVDAETGRGVPLVELRTNNNICLHTDSGGVAAFFEPGLMHQQVFFHVTSHGYTFPIDGFGHCGRALSVTPGGHARIEVRRVNVAERLYRITGGGIYRDSLLVGRKTPIRQPLLNAQVLGTDSVFASVWRGQIYWFWGDTHRVSYPLGNLKTPGATSELPGQGGLDPEVGVDLKYFVDPDGFPKKTANPAEPGYTWVSGLVVVGDAPHDTSPGSESLAEDRSNCGRLFVQYSNIADADPPQKGVPGVSFRTCERGLLEFDDQQKQFHKVANAGRDLVRGSRSSYRPLGLRPEDHHPRAIQLLQPRAPSIF